MKVAETTDISFNPFLYSQELLQKYIEEDVKNRELRHEKLKNENPEMYTKYLELQQKIEDNLIINDHIQDMRKSVG